MAAKIKIAIRISRRVKPAVFVGFVEFSGLSCQLKFFENIMGIF